MATDPLDHPENRGVAARFAARARPGRAAVERPDEARPLDAPGTHPDLVARLWTDLGGALPADCRRLFSSAPVLMHPETGVVFALAEGTHAYALRLPPAERAEALAAGAARVHEYPHGVPFDLAEIGPDWVFGRWLAAEERWCAAAYAHAGGAR